MLRRAFRNLVKLEEPPERTALAFAVGTFIAFSPLLGLHMIIAGLLLMIWRVNRVALFTGVFLTNPWTFPPAIAASWGIGRMIIGSPQIELPRATFSALLTSEFWQSLASQWQQLLPYALGAIVLATIISPISYWLMLTGLRAYRRKFLTGTVPEADLLQAESITERN
ncbi:MAG: DUF2062 domain-containing protein [Acidobacteria bacterium]|nr:DUF2062 domain-containing protein [Acidobacteriota bacterium]